MCISAVKLDIGPMYTDVSEVCTQVVPTSLFSYLKNLICLLLLIGVIVQWTDPQA